MTQRLPWHDTVPTSPAPLDAASAADEFTEYTDDEAFAFATGMLNALAITILAVGVIAFLYLCYA